MFETVNNLKALRNLFGYTQADLAKIMGRTQNYYTLIETGVGKSAPVLKEISREFKIRDEFLIRNHGEVNSFRYPFLTDFYIFCLSERETMSFQFILKVVCQRSEILDIINLQIPGGYIVKYILLRDDQNTLFLLKRKDKRRVKLSRSNNREFPNFGLFHQAFLDLKGPLIYERWITIPSRVAGKIENGSVKKSDLLNFLPNTTYFKILYNLHSKSGLPSSLSPGPG